MKKCDVCEHAHGELRTNGLIVCCDCEYDPSKRKLITSLEICNIVSNKNEALKKAISWHANHAKEMHEEITELREALSDAVNGKSSYDLVSSTGLSLDRCQQIIDLLGRR